MNREKAFTVIGKIANEWESIIVAGNGFQARYLYGVSDRLRNFYMLGSMGLASSIGLGLASSRSNEKVIVVEGDGNSLMGQGSQAVIGFVKPRNLIHIVLNNEMYETTGGQPTVSPKINFTQVALGNGYEKAVTVDNEDELENELRSTENGPLFIEVILKRDEKAMSRVPFHPVEIKKRFMQALHG